MGLRGKNYPYCRGPSQQKFRMTTDAKSKEHEQKSLKLEGILLVLDFKNFPRIFV
jgi:hypothetical protein